MVHFACLFPQYLCQLFSEHGVLKSEDIVANGPLPSTPTTTPCVRVISTTPSASNPSGKPVQLLTLPKRPGSGGSQISIRLPQISSNPSSVRPIFLAGASSTTSVAVIPHFSSLVQDIVFPVFIDFLSCLATIGNHHHDFQCGCLWR